MMKTLEKIFPTIRTGRYFANEINTVSIKNVVVLLHGYAQLAEDFIKEFSFLDMKGNLLIAPEGLSRFYKGDKVGASWMSREFREHEINDYVKFISNIYSKEISLLEEIKINNIVIGFSQGAHTAVRFSVYSDIPVDSLVLCCSAFPEDLKEQLILEKLLHTKIFFICGSEDKVVSQDKILTSFEYLKSLGLSTELIVFKGKHEINPKSVLNSIQ